MTRLGWRRRSGQGAVAGDGPASENQCAPAPTSALRECGCRADRRRGLSLRASVCASRPIVVCPRTPDWGMRSKLHGVPLHCEPPVPGPLPHTDHEPSYECVCKEFPRWMTGVLPLGGILLKPALPLKQVLDNQVLTVVWWWIADSGSNSLSKQARTATVNR